MSVYIIPILILFLLIYSRIKKVDTYKSFTTGAKKSFNLIFDIFPYILAILVCIALIRISGISNLIIKIISPIFNTFGIPTEVCELVLLRPFTGSGSLGLLEQVLASYGTDTYIGRCASVIMGSSETLFYVATIYFSQTKVKKLRYTLPIGIIVSIISSILACLLCKFL